LQDENSKMKQEIKNREEGSDEMEKCA